MKTLLLIAKIIGGLIASAVLLVVIVIATILIRKSGWFILRSDVEKLVSGVLSEPANATAFCGIPADVVMSPSLPTDNWPPFNTPSISLRSWRPVLPMSGTIEARVSGIAGKRGTDMFGAQTRATVVSAQRCEGIVRIDYRFRWEDNGRSVGLSSEVVGTPTIEKTK